MVHVIEDWETFSEHAEKYVRQGLYREILEMDDLITIRIIAGRLGFEQSFDKDAKKLDQYRTWLKFHGFIKVTRSVEADRFLR